jgi:hypothetical protein
MDVLQPNRASVGDFARKVRSALGAGLLSVALAACGGGGDSPAAANVSTGPGGSVAGNGNVAATGGAAVAPGSDAVAGRSAAPGGSDAGAGGGGAAVSDSGPVAPSDAIPVASAPGATTLSWVPPTTNVDGTPLKLTGYRIYWSQSKDHFSHSVTLTNPGLTRYVVDQLAPATWYFVATALSADGESEFSNVFAMQVL